LVFGGVNNFRGTILYNSLGQRRGFIVEKKDETRRVHAGLGISLILFLESGRYTFIIFSPFQDLKRDCSITN
jgi:hypothetical protein